MAAGDAALARIVAPYRRRNRIVAASQASYAVFQFQAPLASEPPNAASMALRRALASMGPPSSSSVKSCRAALTTEEATTAVARMENGAALARSRRDWVMGDHSGEREWAEPPGALLKTAQLKPFPARLFLFGPRMKMGTGAARW